MKLTTKIILGFLLTVFITSLVLIIGFSFSDRTKFERNFISDRISIPQEKTGIELPSFKTIVIEKTTDTKKLFPNDDCYIKFESAKEEHSANILFIPEAMKDFVSVHSSDDTLKVKLDMDALIAKFDNSDYPYSAISGVNMHFYTSKTDIIQKIEWIPVIISNIETDSIKIRSRGTVNIVDCKAIVIDPLFDDRRLIIKNTEAKRVYIDMDHIPNWNFENCNIEEEYITGSKRYNMTYHKNEAKIIYWVPKEKDATLNIKIEGEPAKIIIQ